MMVPAKDKTWLYLAADTKAPLFKIGISNSVKKRITVLHGGDRTVKLLDKWHRPFDARQVEALVKALLMGYAEAHRGQVSEWFRVSRVDMDAAIECAFAIADRTPPVVVVEILKRLPPAPGPKFNKRQR